mgnify:CR=1 FL=1
MTDDTAEFGRIIGADLTPQMVPHWELELWRDVITITLREMRDVQSEQMYDYFAESTKVGMKKIRDQIADYVREEASTS